MTGFMSAAPDSPHLPTAGSGGDWISMKPELYEGQEYNSPYISLTTLFVISG